MNNNEKKYELIPVLHPKVQIFQLKSLKDFSDVKKGDLGGYVHDENTLSHNGDCWIYQESCVGNGCKVDGNSKISNGVTLLGDVLVEDTTINGRIVISGSSIHLKDSNIINTNVNQELNISGSKLKFYGCIIGTSITSHDTRFKNGTILVPNHVFTYGSPDGEIYVTVYAKSNGYKISGRIFNNSYDGDIEKVAQQLHSSKKDYIKYEKKSLKRLVNAINGWIPESNNFKDIVYG